MHVQDGNRLTNDNGQVQLDGLTDLALLTGADVGANRLRRALHRFGCHLQTSQHLHLLAAVIERNLLSHDGLHAAHAGRTVAVFHVQQAIHGELSVMTVRTWIPGAQKHHFAQGSEKPSGAQFAVACLVAAGTGNGALVGGRLGKLQQLSESRRAGLMHSGAESHLDCFQIQDAALLPLGEDTAQQRGYFARDLLVDRFGRFFSCGVSVSSTGRAWQIFSLTSEQFATRFPKAVKGFDFTLCLVQLCRRGEGFTDCLPIDFARQAEVGAVARLVWLMTTALRFTAAAADSGDGTAAKIPQIDDAVQNGGPLLFERAQSVWQVAPRLLTYNYVRNPATNKRNHSCRRIYVAHPLKPAALTIFSYFSAI